MLHDEQTGEHIHLYIMFLIKVTFDIHNSPLSEAAVVGFEYGYNVENKKASYFGKHNMVILQYVTNDFSTTSY